MHSSPAVLWTWASAHRGRWGQLTPLENGWKIKKRKHAKKSSCLCLCYILRAIRASRCRERRYADHIFIQIYFRMHHFVVKFSKFSSPQVARGHCRPNENPADVPGCGGEQCVRAVFATLVEFVLLLVSHFDHTPYSRYSLPAPLRANMTSFTNRKYIWRIAFHDRRTKPHTGPIVPHGH